MSSANGRVVSVNVSPEKGTPKRPVSEIVINEQGVDGDAHAGPGHRQVSLLSMEQINAFSQRTGRKITPGEFAENITTSGIDIGTAALMDRFVIGSVELEVTQIGKECHGAECAIFRDVGECLMPKEGLFCRVLRVGRVRRGDAIEHVARPLRFRIITVSDRAYRGDYEDRSGPRIREMLQAFLEGKRWHPEITNVILPDDRDALRAELVAARDGGVDVVFTTGGTGVGPRDSTPEAVASVCDKLIPGVMEYIRVKYAAANPNVLVSRSVVGVAGRTLIYALPGSVRAVEEYMSEILRTLEHLIVTVHGLDTH
ncbi:MAG: molybdenum cofactor synthesis domain-containing protein [Armatimonadota bacterium]